MIALINDLRRLPSETSWVEFKHNNSNPEMIGERISALSNGARLADKNSAYLVWGIEDETHAIVGTDFQPSMKHKGQPLEFWLNQKLKPSVHLEFKELEHPEGRLVLLDIPAAVTSPLEFDRVAYIRIGSATPRLADQSATMLRLWEKLRAFAWEKGVAAEFVSTDDVLRDLDYPAFFDLIRRPLPDNREGIIEQLVAEDLIRADAGGHWNVTNLGAMLFAKDLRKFARVSRKAVRIVVYGGSSRASPVTHRREGQLGYASGFEGVLAYLNGLLPRNEHIGQALREEHPMYPELAIRELVANALIHQDMTVTGAGPMIEVFSDRIEITNPGVPLMEPDRMIDMPPRSRNETLASLMRRMRICEEQGSGVDKVVTEVELFQLPPPDFRSDGDNTRVVLLSPRTFAEMTAAERIRACYQHAVLKFLAGEKLTNSTLRQRLGIADQNAAQVSRIINEAKDGGFIRYADPESPRAGYVPAWA